MTLEVLVKELENILRVHPESKDATVWSLNDRETFQIVYVRLDKKRKKTPRVYLED
jgi:hypothetical protein